MTEAAMKRMVCSILDHTNADLRMLGPNEPQLHGPRIEALLRAIITAIVGPVTK